LNSKYFYIISIHLKQIDFNFEGEEFIKLAPEDERGWCLGKIGEKIGLYPATYATNA
jgi:hypothetical protein